jgi:predicted transcriptional regulator
MKIGDICSREVFVVGANEALANAVREMDSRHVGAVVVAETQNGVTRPVGIVTDRDVLRGQFDRKADLFCLTVGDVMTSQPLVLHEECDLANAIELMSARVVRRAPVIDQQGALVGIVSFDDLLPAVAESLAAAARLIGSQPQREH